MRSKFKWIFTLLLAFSMQFSFAQEKTVTGTVTDASGLPLPGATVVVKGTNRGTSTDFDGKYSIKASAGETLDFSFVGYKTSSIKVGASNVVNTSLSEDNILGEVVVTGQAIKKEKKALGYAVTTISNEDFAAKPSTDVARALVGKAPGVNIQQTSGLSGSGTNIIVRGYSSLTLSNQPLFVVDGVPFNSDTNSDRGFTTGATTSSSRFLDLDPNTIESVSVLKGLSATTLYGSAGRNGVILVTTKSGNTKDINKKMSVSVTQSLFLTEISKLPEYQNNYGNGFYQNYSPAFSNWGPRFGTAGQQGIAADGTIPHWYSTVAGYDTVFPEFQGVRVPYAPQNNVEPFFSTGVVNSTTVSVGGRSETTTYNLGVGRTDDKGFIENNRYQRINLNMGGQTKLSNKFTISSSVNYSKIDKVAPPTAAGFGSNPSAGAVSAFANILYVPRSFDLFGVPFQNPIDGSSVYYRTDIQNPRWTLKNVEETEDVRRMTANATALYEINSWSNLSYRVGYDAYNQVQEFKVNKGGPQSPDGSMRTTNRINTIWDHTLSYNFDKQLGGENSKWNLDGTVGFNPRSEIFDFTSTTSTVQFLFGLMDHSNFENRVNDSFRSTQNIMGLYGSFTLAYNKYLYFNLQGRNDWASTLETANNSIFYPSASLSFVPTDAFSSLKGNKTVNFLKLRLGYGTSAGFPGPYNTRIGLASGTNVFNSPFGGVVNALGVDSQLGNLNLKPELHRELEFGIEGTFFDRRLTLDASVYDKRSFDLLYFRNLDPSTGFTSILDNISELSNKGVEISLNAKIIRPKTDDGFRWDMTGMYTTNRNIVEEIGNGSDNGGAFAGFTNLGNFAVAGRPYGVIYGSAIARDANGNRIVDFNGSYLATEDVQEIGDPNADFRSTLINEFAYKNFSLQFQLEYTHGGDMYSTTASALISRGLTKDTDFDRSQTFVLPGVLPNGNINNVQIPAAQWGFENNGFVIDEQAIYDATHLRLREVSLSYDFPKKMIERTPFGKISISFIGQNLWFKAFNLPKYVNFDPEVSSLGVGNGQGFDYLTGPTAKRYGFNLNLTF